MIVNILSSKVVKFKGSAAKKSTSPLQNRFQGMELF